MGGHAVGKVGANVSDENVGDLGVLAQECGPALVFVVVDIAVGVAFSEQMFGSLGTGDPFSFTG